MWDGELQHLRHIRSPDAQLVALHLNAVGQGVGEAKAVLDVRPCPQTVGLRSALHRQGTQQVDNRSTVPIGQWEGFAVWFARLFSLSSNVKALHPGGVDDGKPGGGFLLAVIELLHLRGQAADRRRVTGKILGHARAVAGVCGDADALVIKLVGVGHIFRQNICGGNVDTELGSAGSLLA